MKEIKPEKSKIRYKKRKKETMIGNNNQKTLISNMAEICPNIFVSKVNVTGLTLALKSPRLKEKSLTHKQDFL